MGMEKPQLPEKIEFLGTVASGVVSIYIDDDWLVHYRQVDVAGEIHFERMCEGHYDIDRTCAPVAAERVADALKGPIDKGDLLIGGTSGYAYSPKRGLGGRIR